MKSELCRTCVHTKVCMKDKNTVGDFYVAPHPFFFDEEYKKKSWEKYKLREKQGFPCDDYKAEKHGHWIKEGYSMWCSECGGAWDNVWSFTYCPNCGVKMDGGENE